MNAIHALSTFLLFWSPLKTSVFYPRQQNFYPLPILHNDDARLFRHDLRGRALDHNHFHDDNVMDVSKRVASCTSHERVDTSQRSRS